MLCFDIGLRRRAVAGGTRHTLGDNLGRGLRTTLFAAKGCALRIHKLLGDFAAGEIDIKIHLCCHIAGADNRADKRDHAVAVNLLKTNAMLKLSV